MFPRQRAQEMWNWIYQLESEKFDFIEHMKHQKYEVGSDVVMLKKETEKFSIKKKQTGWTHRQKIVNNILLID